ncbi:MAG: acyl-coenzyme A synthetase/AMP-(fatty) acid ligase [Ascidiaceihabitans sp.]|jgi:acyl-coenzyme A synthetase/AMP-(fatty) acid ligase
MPFNMAAHVLGQSTITPHKTALQVLHHDRSENWTYSDLETAVRGIATGLLEAGATAGDLILMRLGNTVDYPLAYLGALAAGLVPVPTSAALTESEVARIIDELSPRLILRDPKVASPEKDNQIDVAQLREMRLLPAAPYHMGDPERLGYVVYTSGTSGKPRAVAHAHRAIWARQMMFEGWYGLRKDDRLLHAGAFNWTYTMGTGLMDPWTIGATALIPAAGIASESLPALLASNNATIFAAAPGVYRQLLKGTHPLDLPALRHGLSAGEKLPASTLSAWTNATDTPIFEAYGMSECSTFISGCPSKPASAERLGQPQKGRRLAIIGPDGPVPRGTEGTIAIHHLDQGLMLGYLNAADETAAKMQGDWFLTGDQGVMFEDDQISYLGRDDDMMNAGGYRVSPIEVEQGFAGAHGITAIAATQVEVKANTRVIAAFYTAPAAIDEAILQAHATLNLARYKQPRLYIHVNALPMGANGKILRKVLRDGFGKTRN